VSDSKTDPLRGLLSEFALGPAWARQGSAQPAQPQSHEGDRPQRSDRERDRGPRRDGGSHGSERRDQRDGRREFRGRDDRRSGPHHRQEEAPPAQGVRVTLVPDPQAIHLIGKEIHQVARVYPLFDIARILLDKRGRCRAVFERDPGLSPMLRGNCDESLFLTREEALRHFWQSDWRTEFIEEETIEVDPPTGNFQAVARCGISGEWLGPPNFHAYQVTIRRIHRERFSTMPFEAYSARVRTERGEEAVNAWLETMKTKTRWRLKSDTEAPWIDDRAEIERLISTTGFAKAFSETHTAEVSAAIPGKNLSPSLLTTLRLAGSHARKHPAILIPAVCKALEAEHLPVFKRQGKLHTGPARPHALAPGTVLAERPAAMVTWIKNNKPATLAGLWAAVLPEGVAEPTPDYAADLFWLLQQGHILLYTDDVLVVQEPREQTPSKKSKEPQPQQHHPKAAATPPVTPSSESAGNDTQSEGSTSGDPAPEPATSEDPGPAADPAANIEADTVPSPKDIPPHDFMPVDSSSDTRADVTPGPPLPGPEIFEPAQIVSNDPLEGEDVETEERLIELTSDAAAAPEEQAVAIASLLPTSEVSDAHEVSAELDEIAAADYRPDLPPDLETGESDVADESGTD
jgi:hypothetical protein